MGSFDCMQGHFCVPCGVAWDTLSLRLLPSHFVSLGIRLGFGQVVPTASRGIVPGSSKGTAPKGMGKQWRHTMAGQEGPAPRYLSKETRRQPGSARSPNHQVRSQQ